MPHVRAEEYVRPGDEYTLLYVEAVQRHHKRTPYASNTLPREDVAVSLQSAVLMGGQTDAAVGLRRGRTVRPRPRFELQVYAYLLAEYERDRQPFRADRWVGIRELDVPLPFHNDVSRPPSFGSALAPTAHFLIVDKLTTGADSTTRANTAKTLEAYTRGFSNSFPWARTARPTPSA